MQTIRDPGLDDILSEPMIVRLMASDRIRTEDARALFDEVARRIRRRDEDHDGGRAAGVQAPGGIIYG